MEILIKNQVELLEYCDLSNKLDIRIANNTYSADTVCTSNNEYKYLIKSNLIINSKVSDDEIKWIVDKRSSGINVINRVPEYEDIFGLEDYDYIFVINYGSPNDLVTLSDLQNGYDDITICMLDDILLSNKKIKNDRCNR